MWIDLEGLANLRDVGGMPTEDGGTIRAGQLLRSDNLQSLTPGDVEALIDLGLTDVIDLRSDYEAEKEGPTALVDTPVNTHQYSLFREWREGVGEDKPDVRPEALPEEALPWVDLEPNIELDNELAAIYMSYLLDRPDSVIAALRTIADAPGAALVHCAAGKDRTGTIVALALSLAGADRDAIIEDYVASSERMQAIIDRLRTSNTYAENMSNRPLSSHMTHAETMEVLLDHLDESYGGVEPALEKFGWTAEDTEALRKKLRG